MVAAKATTEYATGSFDSINEALVAFQSTIPIPVKDSTADTGKYGYSYSSLDALVPLIFPRLAAVGLAYSAVPHVRTEDGIFVLRAALKHTSGEEITGDYPLGNPNAPAQAVGSALSYARRYALLALTGVAPTGEDDDGAAAQNTPAAPVARESAAPAEGSAGGLKAAMSTLLNADGAKVTGEDANAVMEEVAPGKTPGQWTAPDLKKGLAKLTDLDTQRREAK